jgi:DNA-binding transcriptional MerR regulator
MEEKDLLTVGELAKIMDTTVRTLQFYDKEGLLNPSSRSEGGRRLYTKKDMVKLHQILSMKFLGFSLDQIKNNLISLDTPQEVIHILSKQAEVVRKQIEDLTSALSAIEALQGEISQMQIVNFDRYADIIALLRLKNEGYWVLKYFDNKFITHIKDRFTDKPQLGNALYKDWDRLGDETVFLKSQEEPPESERSQELAKQWWNLIMEVTGGDLSLLPELIKFDQSKQDWDKELQKKQEIIDEFLTKALEIYFKNQGIEMAKMEVDK